MFWTDHGEQLLDHGRLGHGHHLYEEENHSVVAFQAPGLTPLRWEGPTTHADIWPTVLDALQIPAPGSWTGVPAGRRSDESPRFALRHKGAESEILQSVERCGLKLLYSWSGQKELYDLRQDPLEQEDLYDPGDPEVIALWELLMPWVGATHSIHPEWSPTAPGP